MKHEKRVPRPIRLPSHLPPLPPSSPRLSLDWPVEVLKITEGSSKGGGAKSSKVKSSKAGGSAGGASRTPRLSPIAAGDAGRGGAAAAAAPSAEAGGSGARFPLEAGPAVGPPPSGLPQSEAAGRKRVKTAAVAQSDDFIDLTDD